MPNSKQIKGRAWERKIAKHLSLIFDQNFLRTPGSGAYTGGKNIIRKDLLTEQQQRMMDGDIIVPPCMSNYKIECKSYKKFDFHQLFTQNKTLDSWIKQVEDGDLWFLVVSITRKIEFILFPKKFYGIYEISENCCFYKNYIITSLSEFFEKNKDIIVNLNDTKNQSITC